MRHGPCPQSRRWVYQTSFPSRADRMACQEVADLLDVNPLIVTQAPSEKSAAKNGNFARNSAKPASKKRGLKKKMRQNSILNETLNVPNRLHDNLWFNSPLMGNDGAECCCPVNLRNRGPHHGRFVLEDEQNAWPFCPRSLSRPTVNFGSAKELLVSAVASPVSRQPVEASHDALKNLQCDNHCSLFHYVLNIFPGTNYVSDCARRTCVIGPNGKRFNFEGFLIFSHEDLSSLPAPVIILFGYQYTLTLKPFDFCRSVCGDNHDHSLKCKYCELSTISDAHNLTKLDMLTKYITSCLLELHDWNLQPSFSSAHGCDSLSVTGATLRPSTLSATSCDFMHFMPLFRDTTSNRILPVQQILEYCVENYRPVIIEANDHLAHMRDETEKLGGSDAKVQLSDSTVVSLQELRKSRSLQNDFQQLLRGAIVHNPGARPAAVRVDQIEVELTAEERKEFIEGNKTSVADDDASQQPSSNNYPVIIHFGHKPAHLACCGNPEYLNIYKKFQRLNHLNYQNRGIGQSAADVEQRETLREKLLEMRKDGKLKREVKCMLSAENFFHTGLSSDIMQQALLLPVVTFHYRYQRSLQAIEALFEHKFKNRQLLQLALTHPSFRMTYGTNADHVRNSLTNCGARHMQYGPMHEQHQRAARKSGIITQTDIMSRLGSDSEQQSKVQNYERLEFLGDAVLEFLVSRRLYGLFPDFQEGVLATYRSALVDNAHLGFVADHLGFRNFLLTGHGTDLCSEMDMRHTLANCFEACIGALFLDNDGDLEKPDRFIGKSLFGYVDNTVDNEPANDADETLTTLQKTWLSNTRYHDFAVEDPNGDRYWLQKAPMLQHLIGFEQRVGFTFHRIRLLAKAFILKSSATMHVSTNGAAAAAVLTNGDIKAKESCSMNVTKITLMPSSIPQIVCGNNERLEFLGDSVLQLMVSEHLYKHYPTHHEGHLSLLRSSLVSNNTLACVCDELEMEKYQQLLLGVTLPAPSANGVRSNSDDAESSISLFTPASVADIKVSSEMQTVSVASDKNPCEEPGQKKKRFRRRISLEPGELSSSDSDNGGRNDRRRYSPAARRQRYYDDGDSKKSTPEYRQKSRAKRERSPPITPHINNKQLQTDGDNVRKEARTPPSPTGPKNGNASSEVRSTADKPKEQTITGHEKSTADTTETQQLLQQRRSKYKADLVEAFIGALYLDQGLDACYNFIDVNIIAKAQRYIQEQRWIDPKSMLQQCCLTLRSVTSSDGKTSRKPDVPRYECVEENGPPNRREYKVAVYFRKEKLAEGTGRSIADAQASAAANALQFKSIFATQMERTKQQIKLKVDRQLEQKKRATEGVRLDRHGNVMSSSCQSGSSHSNQRQHLLVDRHGQPRKRELLTRPARNDRSRSRDRRDNSRRSSPSSASRHSRETSGQTRHSDRPSERASGRARLLVENRPSPARYAGSGSRRRDNGRVRSRSRSRHRERRTRRRSSSSPSSMSKSPMRSDGVGTKRLRANS